MRRQSENVFEGGREKPRKAAALLAGVEPLSFGHDLCRQVASHHHVFRKLPACAQAALQSARAGLLHSIHMRKKWEAWREAIYEQGGLDPSHPSVPEATAETRKRTLKELLCFPPGPGGKQPLNLTPSFSTLS